MGSASAMYISSTHAGDTGVNITIEYLDDDGLPQTVTKALDGTDSTTFVDTLVTAIYVNRAYVTSDAVTLNGVIYISADNTDVGGDGIPDTLTDTFAVIPIADNQTTKAEYLVPVGFRIEVYGWKGTLISGGASTRLTFRIKHLPSGGSWRTIDSDGVVEGSTTHAGQIWPFTLSFPALTQVAVEVQEVSAANSDVTGDFFFEFIKI